MKHHGARRPIGRCKGCCLNLKTYCAGGFQAKEQWRHGRCKHYGDEELLARVLEQPQPSGAKLAHLMRKAKAVAAATTPHYNGVLDPGKMAGRAKRPARVTAQ